MRYPPLQCSSPLGRSRAKKKPFLEKLLQPLGIFFILFTCCRFLGGPRTCSGGHGKPSLYFYKWGWGMGRQLRPLPPPRQQVRQCVRRQAQWKGREQVGQWEPLLCWQSCTLHFLFWERVWHLNLPGVPQFWCLGVRTLLGECEVCVSVHGMVKRCRCKEFDTGCHVEES